MKEPIETLAGTLRLLSDPSRLRILRVLTEDCQHVSDVAAATGLSQPLVSHHLRVLKQHGLVQSERQGAFTTYCIRDRALRRDIIRLCELAQRLSGPNLKSSSR